MAVELVVGVAVDKVAFSFDKLFTYRVPQELESQVKCGCRVLVPFGNSNRKRQGIILEVSELNEPQKRLKPISAMLDEDPILKDEEITLVKYLKNTTFCTYYDAVRTILPLALNFDIKRSYSADENFDGYEELSDEEKRIYNAVKVNHPAISGEKLCSMFGIALNAPILQKMCKKGALKSSETAMRRKKDETVTMVRMADGYSEAIEQRIKKLTDNQKKVIEFLKEAKEASVKEISYFTACTRAVTDNLRKKGIVEYFERNVELQKPLNFHKEREQFILNDEQQKVFDGLLDMYRQGGKKNTALLFGVTGSGKTQVFMRLIEEVVKDKKQVIVMVPEIALTPQTIARFEDYFGNDVAVIHSGLSVKD